MVDPLSSSSEWSATRARTGLLRRIVFPVVDFARTRYLAVIAATLLITAGLAFYAKDLQPRPDLMELLPRDSAGFKALEHQFARMGGGSSLLVVVSSPNRAANEKMVDSLSEKLQKFVADAKQCTASTCQPNDAACMDRCNDGLVAYLELNTKDVRAYYEKNKFLYADLDDLERTEQDIDKQIALRGGLVENLEEESKPAPAPASSAAPAPGAGPGDAPVKKSALGIGDHLAKWDERANRQESYPTGYFANPESTLLGIRIVSNTYLGDPRADRLLATVGAMIEEAQP